MKPFYEPNVSVPSHEQLEKLLPIPKDGQAPTLRKGSLRLDTASRCNKHMWPWSTSSKHRCRYVHSCSDAFHGLATLITLHK